MNSRAVPWDIQRGIGDVFIIWAKISKNGYRICPVLLLRESENPLGLHIWIEKTNDAEPSNVFDVNIPF